MAKTRVKKETIRVKPSELSPKDKTLQMRYNSYIDKLLKDKGYASFKEFVEKALDKELGKVEYEKKITFIPKKTNKN